MASRRAHVLHPHKLKIKEEELCGNLGSSGIRVGPGMGLTSTFARQGLGDQSGRGAG